MTKPFIEEAQERARRDFEDYFGKSPIMIGDWLDVVIKYVIAATIERVRESLTNTTRYSNTLHCDKHITCNKCVTKVVEHISEALNSITSSDKSV